MNGGDARKRILRRVARAVRSRRAVEHPGDLEERGSNVERDALVASFRERFERNGGETAMLVAAEAKDWVGRLLSELGSEATVCRGSRVPEELTPDAPEAPPLRATLGISLASAAAMRSGTLVLDARGGRRAQLLPATHLVFLPASRIVADLADALTEQVDDLPSALGLHSGPSKSADIGRTVVTGVHGPGRVIAAVLRDR